MTGSGSEILLPRRRRRRQSNWRGLAYIAPAMALVIVFFIMPVLFTGWMSLHNWPLMGASRWIGLNNYYRMVNDTRFVTALNFTAYYTVIVTIAIFAVAFPLAIFVEKERQFVSAYRTIIFLPVVVGLATASLLWVWLANVDSGFIGPALKALGLLEKSPNLLATFDTAFLTIVVMVVWKIAGFTMIILLTGLQAIPSELTEAARIDGAGRWQRFRHLTLPLMRKTIALALIVSVTGSILAFDQFYIMTSGGPQNKMISVVYYIFNQSFVSFNLGYGAALSIVLLAILVAISIVQLWLLRVGEERP
ncbi:multiple sugar transport system permease protein [Rhizobium sp. BK619]|uniref:Binding-protein-dependent transport systems inner membrane component n=3 Tax=Rhizobium TaxID=379 RepID=A0ABF7QS27_RHILW|nr:MULTISPECIES: sugar ABC transporter permease [Rhizobium]ACI56886.1 binding-protein-dependent transport systems inner membrane component [Rhizobium leguminosarum bv. trifolii WSM2304]EJB05231.1 permease component of ABC-type sugar transporter [Rhizobium leguminosarum bv. trifolii WSM597]KPH09331.1 sugar ABC transporter permease [Rhizobium acidisoli]MBB3644895.1 multiple sugar transport system permease protein [Rhizobium sp. BK619]QAS79953.1 sugar ABC transporter permease [Rhizobium acidisoli